MKNRTRSESEDFLVISLLQLWRNISKDNPHGEKRKKQDEFCLKLLNTREELQGRTADGVRQYFLKVDRIVRGEYDYDKLRDNEKVFYGIHKGLEDII